MTRQVRKNFLHAIPPTKKSIILLAAAIAIVSGIVLTYFIQGGTSERFANPERTHSLPTSVLRRRFLPESSIQLIQSFTLSQRAYRLIHSQDRLFAQLWDAHQIAQIDASSGTILQTYGRRGSAPGEFKNINDVSIDASGIYVTDASNLTLNHYAFDGALIACYSFSAAFFKSLRLTGTQYILKSLDPGDKYNEILQVYDASTQNSRTFEATRLLPSQTSASGRGMENAVLSISHKAGRSFFVHSASGQFMAFDTLGNLLYQKRTIDESPLPKILIRKLGNEDMAMSAPNTREINVGADANEKYLYILSNAADPTIPQISPTINKIGVIDIYDAFSGDYLQSVKLPPIYDSNNTTIKLPRQIAISQNRLYILADDNVICSYSFDSSLAIQ